MERRDIADAPSRFYGRIRRSALAAVSDEVERQRDDREYKHNSGDDREPDAGECEQRRPRRAGALGLGGEVVRRPFGSRTGIAGRLLVPRPIGHDATLIDPAST